MYVLNFTYREMYSRNYISGVLNVWMRITGDFPKERKLKQSSLNLIHSEGLPILW